MIRRCLEWSLIGTWLLTSTSQNLPQPSHPPYSSSADDWTCTDAGLQSDTVKARLLQRCAPRHSIQQHPEATAHSEQCSSDRSSGAEAISHQTTTTLAALAAGSTPNHVQVGCTDVQGPDHINTSVSQSTHQVTWQRADSTLGHDHSTVRTVRQYSFYQACFPLFCSGHLELSAKNSYWQQLTRNIQV